jgi:hypothetical protein
MSKSSSARSVGSVGSVGSLHVTKKDTTHFFADMSLTPSNISEKRHILEVTKDTLVTYLEKKKIDITQLISFGLALSSTVKGGLGSPPTINMQRTNIDVLILLCFLLFFLGYLPGIIKRDFGNTSDRKDIRGLNRGGKRTRKKRRHGGN